MIARIADLPRSSNRVSAKAAGVPMRSANRADKPATITERAAADSHCGDSAIATYHWVENSAGGHSINAPLEKDTGIKKRAGTERKSNTRRRDVRPAMAGAVFRPSAPKPLARSSDMRPAND